MKTHSCCAWSVTTSRAAQHNTTHNRRASLVPEFKAFFFSQIWLETASPTRTKIPISKVVNWCGMRLLCGEKAGTLLSSWRGSLRLSLSRLGCCWYACRILIFQQRQQLWPLASLFFILAASPFAVLWRTDQTKQCPAQKSCCFSTLLSLAQLQHHTVQTHVHQTVPWPKEHNWSLLQTSSSCTSPLSQPTAATSFAEATPPHLTLSMQHWCAQYRYAN